MTPFRKHDETPTGPSDEDPLVRQCRYLLRTAPLDALEAAHVEALDAMDAAHRAHLLTTLRATLLVGGHVRPSHTRRLAHLVTSEEHRAPGTLLEALDAATLYELADKVLQAEACFGLLGGYSAWNGEEPEALDDSLWAAGGFSPKSGVRDLRVDPGRDQTFRFGGGGGGG